MKIHQTKLSKKTEGQPSCDHDRKAFYKADS
jgi:hypothetical protein